MCTRRKVEKRREGWLGRGQEHATGDESDQNISMNENAMMKSIGHSYYTLLKDIF